MMLFLISNVARNSSDVGMRYRKCSIANAQANRPLIIRLWLIQYDEPPLSGPSPNLKVGENERARRETGRGFNEPTPYLHA